MGSSSTRILQVTLALARWALVVAVTGLFFASANGRMEAGHLSLSLPDETPSHPIPLLDVVVDAAAPALVFALSSWSRFGRTARRAFGIYAAAASVAAYLVLHDFRSEFGATWAPLEVLRGLFAPNVDLLLLWVLLGAPLVALARRIDLVPNLAR